MQYTEETASRRQGNLRIVENLMTKQKSQSSPTKTIAMETRTIADLLSRAYDQNADLRRAAEAKGVVDPQTDDRGVKG
jgi:hypothetical protein